jgi:hypothetical protein
LRSSASVRGVRLVSQPDALTSSEALLTLNGIARYDPFGVVSALRWEAIWLT